MYRNIYFDPVRCFFLMIFKCLSRLNKTEKSKIKQNLNYGERSLTYHIFIWIGSCMCSIGQTDELNVHALYKLKPIKKQKDNPFFNGMCWYIKMILLKLCCSNCPNAYFQSQDVKNWNAGIHSMTMIVQTNAIVIWSSVTINTSRYTRLWWDKCYFVIFVLFF